MCRSVSGEKHFASVLFFLGSGKYFLQSSIVLTPPAFSSASLFLFSITLPIVWLFHVKQVYLNQNLSTLVPCDFLSSCVLHQMLFDLNMGAASPSPSTWGG